MRFFVQKMMYIIQIPFLGAVPLWCLTKYIKSTTWLCSIVDFSGSLAPLVLARFPVLILLPVFFVILLPILFVVPLSVLFVVLSSSLSSSPSFGGCGTQFAVMGFVHSPGVLMSGGHVVQYGVVMVVALWGALLCRLYCRGVGWVVVVMVGLPWWWLCCCGGGCTIVIVIVLSSWCCGPRYTCVGLGCSSFHRYGAPSLLCHPRLGFRCRSLCHEDFPTPGLNPRVVM